MSKALKMSNSSLAMLVLVGFSAGLWFYNSELYGDVMRLGVVVLALLWILQRRFSTLISLVLVSGVVLGVAFACKLGFAYTAAHYGDMELVSEFVEIAKRPINGEYKGFPSGHTTAAFLAAALMWRYMGRAWGILGILLAALVGYSRVLSLWHTPLQVGAGAILGFFGALLVIGFLSKFLKRV